MILEVSGLDKSFGKSLASTKEASFPADTSGTLGLSAENRKKY